MAESSRQPVSEVISPAALKQVEELTARLVSANSAITDLSKNAKSVEFGFNGKGDLTQLFTSIKDSQAAITSLAAAVKTFSDASVQLAAIQADLATKMAANSTQAANLLNNINNLTNAVKSNDAANIQAATNLLQAQSAAAKYTMSVGDLASKLALQRLEMQEVNKNIKTLSDAIRANNGDVDANAAKLGTWTQRQAELKLEIADTTSQIRSEIKEVVALTGSMDAMSQELFQMKEQYRALSKEERDNADIGGKLLGNIQKLDTEIKALDATIGNHQRNVGNYNSATMAMSQILREAPAFANSLQTGLMGISNNIPILIDEINRLKIKNEEAVASGQKAIPIWQTLGKSFLSFSNIITLALTAFLLFKDKFVSGTDEVAKHLKELDQDAYASAARQMESAKILQEIAKDTKQSYDIRIKAVKELQDMYPAYLGNLSKEAILAGQTADEMDRLNRSLINKALSEAAISKVSEQAKKYIELNDELQEAQKNVEKFQGWVDRYNASVDKYEKGGRKGLAPIAGAGAEGKVRLAMAKNDVEDLKKQIAEVEATMKKYEQQAADFGKQAAPLLVGKKVTEKQQRQTFNAGGADALTEAQFAAAKARLQIEMENNKAIYESDKYSIEVRKSALNEYYGYETELQKLELQRDMHLNDNIITENRRRIAEKKNLTDDEYKNSLKLIEAAELRNQTLSTEFAAKQDASARKRQKDLLDIEQDGINQRLNAIKEEVAKDQLATTEAYANDILRLQEQLKNKEITQAEYNERAKALEIEHRKQLLNLEIQEDERELEQIGLSATRKLQLKEDIKNKKDQLAGLGTGAAGAKNNPFEGDLIGAGYNELFKRTAPDASDDERIKAAKKASQLTVQLANETANAIMQIEENRFKKRQEMLDRESAQVESNRQREINAIQATAGYSIDKANQMQKVNAQAEAKQSEIEAKKRAENVKAAKFEKAANVARILTSTAAAEAQALSYLSNPATAAIYPVIAGLIAALGGAQLAAAMSAPIPAYRYGTKSHKGGPFIAGEAGENELIQTPDGRSYWSGTKAGLFNEAAGTKVTPESQLKHMAARGLMMGGALVLPKEKDNSKEIAAAYKKGAKEIVSELRNQKPAQVIIINNDSERKYRSKG